MSLNCSLHSSRFVFFIVFALQWKRREKTNKYERMKLPIVRGADRRLDRCSVKSFISARTEQRSIPVGWGGGGCVFKALVKKPPCPQISEIPQGRVEKITRGEPPHSSSFFFFFLVHHLLSKWKKPTLFPVYFLGASPLKLPCVLAVEDWAVCMGKCTSAVSLPNQIEFWCRACVFLRSKKPSHFFSL